MHDIFEIRLLWASQKGPKVFSMCFGGEEIAKTKRAQSISGHPVCPFSEKLWTKLHYKTALIWFVIFHDNGSGQCYLPNNLLTLT